MRIVPSPDWFIGIDSLNLCDGDHWKENISLDLFPYDAGTDSGFTFSSPDFETIPQDKVIQVTTSRQSFTILKISIRGHKLLCFFSLSSSDNIIISKSPCQLFLLSTTQTSSPYSQGHSHQDKEQTDL